MRGRWRLKLWMLMVLVAVVAGMLGGSLWVHRMRQLSYIYRRRALNYRLQMPIMFRWIRSGSPLDRHRLARFDWAARLAHKYEDASAHPWLALGPDEPPPLPPPPPPPHPRVLAAIRAYRVALDSVRRAEAEVARDPAAQGDADAAREILARARGAIGRAMYETPGPDRIEIDGTTYSDAAASAAAPSGGVVTITPDHERH